MLVGGFRDYHPIFLLTEALGQMQESASYCGFVGDLWTIRGEPYVLVLAERRRRIARARTVSQPKSWSLLRLFLQRPQESVVTRRGVVVQWCFRSLEST
jgi:hypothetical protein